jgi:hypothetical protein
VIPEHLYHTPNRLGARGRLIGDLGHDDLPLFSSHQSIAWDDDVMAEAFIVRRYKANTAFRV